MTFNVILDNTYQLTSCLFPRKCCPFLSFQQVCMWAEAGAGGVSGGKEGTEGTNRVLTLWQQGKPGEGASSLLSAPHKYTTPQNDLVNWLCLLLNCELHLSWSVLYSQSLAQLLGYNNSQQTFLNEWLDIREGCRNHNVQTEEFAVTGEGSRKLSYTVSHVLFQLGLS